MVKEWTNWWKLEGNLSTDTWLKKRRTVEKTGNVEIYNTVAVLWHQETTVVLGRCDYVTKKEVITKKLCREKKIDKLKQLG